MSELSTIPRDPEAWTVGVTETCERLGNFDTHDEAAEFISTLPGHDAGIYYIDCPDGEVA